MIIINKKFSDKKKNYVVEIDTYNFHYIYNSGNKKYAEFLFNSFTTINEGLINAYRDMCVSNPGELPNHDRFMEMLKNSMEKLVDGK